MWPWISLPPLDLESVHLFCHSGLVKIMVPCGQRQKINDIHIHELVLVFGFLFLILLFTRVFVTVKCADTIETL